jgi:DNA-binding NtrC family response regulator
MTRILLETESSPAESLPVAAEIESEPPPSSVEPRTLKAARREAINRFEVEYVRSVLRKSEGNVTRAAAIADVSRQVIHKLIAKHRLSQRTSSGG